ncbi:MULTISPECIES: aquaporin Z [Empedobacter]|uniref:Aquaporin Z n=3 Tax=Empedobacter TaxID=59734 RepID=A0A427BG59_9FLAO|nr:MULTISPECIES: aquaporin Z [Empedobacter]MBW1618697.1 aquaporin Z [Empedobacter falsenii]MBY0067938.1 aquaporin Z [Empedobacter falsenii]MDH1603155.1 aquaporin Z [Empedobacter sp. GD03739]RRT86889.1 aquaporin Z [Empedobacter falsenii]RRT88013.1 aquaporin Z [Empedobacter falsenii]
MKNYAAEFFGTFWLVFGGCGSAIFAAGIPELGIGYAGVALAFGLTVLTMAYAVGHISGGHFNPAVSFGLFAGGRFDGKQLIPYIISQVLGAIAAAGVLYLISSGNSDFAIDNTKAGAFASNGYGAFSPHGYSMLSAFLIEFVLTAFFLIVILGATDKFANGKFAGIAIGLALTLIHLISIPITNTSVNPARSTSQAIFVGGEPLTQLWLFWVAPIAGAIVGGLIYKLLLQKDESQA